MIKKLGILFIAFFASQINVSLANLNECNNLARISVCMENQAFQLEFTPGGLTCQASALATPKIRGDYIYTPGIGHHKFHTQAKVWSQARKVCKEEGGHLAIVNSQQEEEVLRNMFKSQLDNIRDAKTIDEAFIGVHDQFQEGDWETVLDDSLNSTGFVNWGYQCYGQQPSSGENQRCGALTHKCSGMDNTWCTMPLAFFCELPDACS